MISRLVAAVVLACATAQVSGGNQQQARPPVFRSGVELIRLDVSVLDRERRPIPGLGREQFTVLEDGVPQRIEVFEAIEFPPAGSPPTSTVAHIATGDCTSSGPERSSRYTPAWAITAP